MSTYSNINAVSASSSKEIQLEFTQITQIKSHNPKEKSKSILHSNILSKKEIALLDRVQFQKISKIKEW